MVRPEEAKVVKAMKEAKTAEEMAKSWTKQRQEAKTALGGGIEFWAERKPEMIFTYAHNQLTQLVDRGILDPKTRFLVILGCYMAENHWEGVLPQCCNAKAVGATEEEMMEVAHIACYAVSKAKLVDTAHAMNDAFTSPVFQGVKRPE